MDIVELCFNSTFGSCIKSDSMFLFTCPKKKLVHLTAFTVNANDVHTSIHASRH